MTEDEKILDQGKLSFSNGGLPIPLDGLQLDGILAEAARQGEKVKMWTRLYLTSDDPMFHRVAEGLSSHLSYVASRSGTPVNLSRSNVILLIIHPDNTGKLWLDTAAIALKVMAKRPMQAGSVVFEHELADITAMSFPKVPIDEKDRVVCIFREGWRFGLFFDFNPGRRFDIDAMERDLGNLYRQMKYRDTYETISDDVAFQTLVAGGWFPFVEIIGKEFNNLLRHIESGYAIGELDQEILEKFDNSRIEAILQRWLAKPHFGNREFILRSAISSYCHGEPVAVIKIILTEIEGILGDAYRLAHGHRPKIKKLLEFARVSAERKAGSANSLLFPVAFAKYLENYTFADFDPVSRTGMAGSRHAVGHGEAPADSYTQVRALQAILTLDQLAFYT